MVLSPHQSTYRPCQNAVRLTKPRQGLTLHQLIVTLVHPLLLILCSPTLDCRRNPMILDPLRP